MQVYASTICDAETSWNMHCRRKVKPFANIDVEKASGNYMLFVYLYYIQHHWQTDTGSKSSETRQQTLDICMSVCLSVSLQVSIAFFFLQFSILAANVPLNSQCGSEQKFYFYASCKYRCWKSSWESGICAVCLSQSEDANPLRPPGEGVDPKPVDRWHFFQ